MHMTGELEQLPCPRGCGLLSYEKLGFLESDEGERLFVAGILLLVFGVWVAIDPVTRSTYSLLPFILGAVLLALGAVLLAGAARQKGKNPQFRYICKPVYGKSKGCGGVLLDYKWLAGVRNHLGVPDVGGMLIKELDSALEAGEKECPGCGSAMARIPLSYVMPDRGGGGASIADALVVAAIQAMIPNKEEYLDLDGCRECGLMWFDEGELQSVTTSETLEGEFAGQAGKKRAGGRYRKARGRAVEIKSGPSYCATEGCRTLTFRRLEHCYKHK
jgi:Zn-finger nucleic acid-binding protein